MRSKTRNGLRKRENDLPLTDHRQHDKIFAIVLTRAQLRTICILHSAWTRSPQKSIERRPLSRSRCSRLNSQLAGIFAQSLVLPISDNRSRSALPRAPGPLSRIQNVDLILGPDPDPRGPSAGHGILLRDYIALPRFDEVQSPVST